MKNKNLEFDIEIQNETNHEVTMDAKLFACIESELKFARNFEDNRPGFFTGRYYDVDMSSHFGFCDDGKVEAILSVDMEILFIDYV